MDIRKLQRAIVDGLEDVKAQDIVVFNTEHLSPLFERVIVASGGSNRQTKALAASVRDTVKARGMQVLRTEGEDNGEWIIVDCGAAVVHIMQPSFREYYHLEELWGGKAVKMKLGAAAPTAARRAASSVDDEDEAPAPAAKKAAAKKAAAKKATVKKAAAKTVAPAKKAPARTAAAKKVIARKTASRGTSVKAAPRKAAPTASAPRKIATKRTATK